MNSRDEWGAHRWNPRAAGGTAQQVEPRSRWNRAAGGTAQQVEPRATGGGRRGERPRSTRPRLDVFRAPVVLLRMKGGRATLTLAL